MKAVIEVGGKQYIVAEKDTLLVDHLTDEAKELKFEPLLVFENGKEAQVGNPVVKGATVEAKVVEEDVKGKKILIGKFQAKKRVKKMQGHRQHYTKIEVTKISA